MSLFPFLFLRIRTCHLSTPALEPACKRTAQFCAAMLANLPYPRLYDAILAHSTMAEGLDKLFS